jgi:acyl carrier protein
MDNTLQVINDIFAGVLKRPGISLRPDDSPKSVEGWDSLTHPELMTSLEEKLDIEFSFRELAGITKISDLITLIESKQNSRG